MSETIKEQELGMLFARAREILITQGHANVRYRREIIRLITANLGNERLDTADLLKLFILSSSKNTASNTKLVIHRPYKPDLAMRQAAARCTNIPQQIGIHSK